MSDLIFIPFFCGKGFKGKVSQVFETKVLKRKKLHPPVKKSSLKWECKNNHINNYNKGGVAMAKYNIGVDYHKKFSYIVVQDEKGDVLREGKVLNTRRNVALFLDPFKKEDSKAVVESCRNWCVMYDFLEDCVGEVLLANSYKVKLIGEAKIKTDRIDAHNLAHLLRADLIPTCYVAPKEIREKRSLLKERVFFVKQRTMLKNRVVTIFDRYPEEVKKQKAHTDLFGKMGRHTLKVLNVSENDRDLIDRELRFIDLFKEGIKEVEKRISEENKDNERVRILQSIPGIGVFLSQLIDAETGNIHRFHSDKKYHCYIGFIPSTYSSGGKTVHGRMTNRGNKYLRWAFVEAVSPAVRSDEELKALYESLQKRIHKNKARVAVARRIATLAYKCLKQKRKFKKLNKIELERKKLMREVS